MMKKIMVALGIAIAIIFGGIFMSFTNTEPAEAAVQEVEPLTIEEATTNYIAKDHPKSVVDNVKVIDIEKDESYGGWRVDATYTLDGHNWNGSFAVHSLGDFEL